VFSLLLLLVVVAAPVWAEEVTAEAKSSSKAASAERQTEQAQERMRDAGTEGDDRVAREAPDVPKPAEPVTTELLFYGSARVRLTAGDGRVRISDNRSRVGMSGFKFVSPLIDIFMRVELGTDLGGDLDNLLIPAENPPDNTGSAFFPRIAKLGFGTPYGDLSFGKQWSTYFDVAGFTDLFAVFGAKGTAIYNAGTDGGGAGTGRADNAVVYRLAKRGLALGVQGQTSTEIPLASGQKYDGSLGFSVTYDWSSGVTAGVAYNRSAIEKLDAELISLGLTGDRQAAVGGVRYSKDKVFISSTVALHENHEVTDQQKYVDALGWEVYARYNFNERLRMVGGFNWLEPDSGDPQAGQYDRRTAIFGLQYTYGELSFGDMIYFEGELNGGRRVDGAKQENAITVGIRYSFEL